MILLNKFIYLDEKYDQYYFYKLDFDFVPCFTLSTRRGKKNIWIGVFHNTEITCRYEYVSKNKNKWASFAVNWDLNGLYLKTSVPKMECSLRIDSYLSTIKWNDNIIFIDPAKKPLREYFSELGEEL